ncbi:TIGR04283 family arsenosugar biosynthesis glycosyltransferase [Marinobacter nanhaiticus D15-8W]|uniref:Glycosyltransferase n=1 Tax=Marinobacter nanhaiticus D15-8W TaxID=626887 RepID=N6WPL2_9GAMM|nr:TIGR04283 family arsenosugar biosynthesis glycosyltransferase [Marinobacter nanhaiticus]ENO13516.1 glycosyltransferase [Marinobacter nanhaiticus D15-8W]BES70885.1 TIGR04283 family arsenosugar biosynthesis glycosyltransferase [Marinobacter nanhaiticus D15-8W]
MVTVPLHVSFIVPVLNEAASIVVALGDLQGWREIGHEVIVVDGGSTDDTVALATPFCDQVIQASKGRASQMNAGAAVAGGEVVVFLHADTRLPLDALEHLQRFVDSPATWGRFDVRLSGGQWIYRVIGGLMNLRSRLTGMCTGDQAMFVRRAMFQEVGGFEPLPLMEDIALSRRLLVLSRPYCVRSQVVTDSRRWEKHGPWKTILMMWRLRWRYWRGEDPASLAEVYYPDVSSKPEH